MEPRPNDREVFVFVPLTIPTMLIYAAVRYCKVTLPLIYFFAVSFTAAAVPLVGVPIWVGSALVLAWWLRIRWLRQAERDAWAADDPEV